MKKSTKQKIIIAVVAPICVALIIVGSILISYSVFPYKKGEVEKATEVTLFTDL